MNEKHEYLILLKIKNNTDINELIHAGLNYVQISELIKNIILSNFVTETSDELTLSDKGIQRFNELDKVYKKTDKNNWIQNDTKNLLKPINKNDIFVPSKNELTFLIKKK